MTSSAFWLGMLFGLIVTDKLTRQFGYRNTVIIGLVISALSFILMPIVNWLRWALPAAAIGFGFSFSLGLRWIANETWLYRLAPRHARGRVVGIHETLIDFASIIGFDYCDHAGTGAALTNKVRQVSIVYTCQSAAGPFVVGFVVSHTSSQSLFWQ